MLMDFASLIYRVSKSDEKAFEELFTHFFPGMLSFAASFLKNQELAEEVVEDIFVKLWENRQTIASIQNISHYLYTAVRYASIDALEKQRKNKHVSFEEIGESLRFSYSSHSPLIHKENCLKISEAINQLPPKCRLIFRLIKEEGMKYREVAQLLDLSEKTIENQMNIAIKKLIESLKAEFPEFQSYFSSSGK